MERWSCPRLRRLELRLWLGPFTARRHAVQDKIGTFDRNLIAAGDLEFWSRIVANRQSVGLINKLLYLYTKSSDQISKSPAHKTRKERDRELMTSKPYPRCWPRGIRWRGFPAPPTIRLAPGMVCVPDGPTDGMR
jgi:hypothetical protein